MSVSTSLVALVVLSIVFSCYGQENNGTVRVAGMMVGEVRTLLDSRVLGHIRASVIEAFSMDLFMYIGMHDLLEPKLKLGRSKSAHLLTLKAALDTLKPVQVEAYDPDRNPVPPKSVWQEVAPCWLEDYRLLKNWRQYYAIKHGFEMIKNHEAMSGFRYDFIVRFRPDVIYSPLAKNPVTLKLPWDIKKQGTPPKKVWGHDFHGYLDDRFHIVSREAADHHFAFERESRVCETPGVLSKCRLEKNNAIRSECVWVDYNKLAGVEVDLSYLKNIETIRDGIGRRDLDKFLQDNGLKNNT